MRDADWQILSILYENCNITKTAELMFMTQPTLTRRLQQIEEELGCTLIQRSNKGVRFTQEGTFVALKAREIIKVMTEVKQELSRSSGEMSGVIRLGAPKSYVHYVIPRIMGEFAQEFPNIRFEIFTDLSHELLKALEAKQIDLSFVRGEIRTTLHKELLSNEQIYILAKEPFAPNDLPSLPRVEYLKENSVIEATAKWWKERFSEQPNIRFTVYSGEACLQMIRQGLGYGIFSDSHYNVPSEGLFAYPLEFRDGSKFTRSSWLVYDEEECARNAILECFVEYLQDQKDLFWPEA